MALPKNRDKVLRILDELEPKILGKVLNGYTAIEIIPGGDRHPGSEVFWNTWVVVMRKGVVGQEVYMHKTLGEFPDAISLKELDELFLREFVVITLNDADAMRYDPPDEALSVRAGLEPSVCIMENAKLIMFRFSWGREQVLAKLLDEIGRRQTTILSSNELFATILDSLRQMPVKVYLGGPEPEHSFESYWLIDYQRALQTAQNTKNLIVSTGPTLNGREVLSAEVTFNK